MMVFHSMKKRKYTLCLLLSSVLILKLSLRKGPETRNLVFTLEKQNLDSIKSRRKPIEGEWLNAAGLLIKDNNNEDDSYWGAVLNKTLKVTRSDISPVCNPDNPKSAYECFCDPFTPFGYDGGNNSWSTHHHRLSRIAADSSNTTNEGLDVLFLGDSITEQWSGTRNLGRRQLTANRDAFLQKFSKQHGGQLEGLAFGAQGDVVQHLHWHIRNGWLPSSLTPKVIWILIGTNNYHHNCTELPERVLTGIFELVRETHRRTPNANIVVQGLLPRGDSMGQLALAKDWIRLQATNRRLKAICEEIGSSKLHYFEVPPELFFATSSGLNQTLLKDGVHPSTMGYHVIGEVIEGEVLRLVSLDKQ